MKNNDKLLPLLYLIASIGFYVSAAVCFFNKSGNAVTFLCLGSAFLCLGVAKKKSIQDKNNSDDNNENK